MIVENGMITHSLSVNISSLNWRDVAFPKLARTVSGQTRSIIVAAWLDRTYTCELVTM